MTEPASDLPNPPVEKPATPRFLALDVGNKRIGVAVSDPLGLTAQPVLTLNRKPNPRDDMRSLARLGRRYGCVGLVVGLPTHLSGEISPQAAKIQRFAEQLAALARLPLTLWDERLTTRAAHEILYAAGKDRKQHKPLVDQVAATLILQSFLDANPASPAVPPLTPNHPAPSDPDPSDPDPFAASPASIP